MSLWDEYLPTNQSSKYSAGLEQAWLLVFQLQLQCEGEERGQLLASLLYLSL